MRIEDVCCPDPYCEARNPGDYNIGMGVFEVHLEAGKIAVYINWAVVPVCELCGRMIHLPPATLTTLRQSLAERIKPTLDEKPI